MTLLFFKLIHTAISSLKCNKLIVNVTIIRATEIVKFIGCVKMEDYKLIRLQFEDSAACSWLASTVQEVINGATFYNLFTA